MSLFLHTVSGGTIDFNGGHIKVLSRDHFTPACDKHTLAHFRAVQSKCTLCQRIDQTLRRWELSRSRIESWALSDGVVPAGLVSAAETAVVSLDYNLANLHVKRRLHVVRHGCSGSEECSGFPIDKIFLNRNGVSEHPSQLDLEYGDATVWRGVPIQSKKRPCTRPWDTDDGHISDGDFVHFTASKPRRLLCPPKPTSAAIETKQSTLNMTLRTQQQASRLHILQPILHAFYSDPLRGLILGRSNLTTCGTCLCPSIFTHRS